MDEIRDEVLRLKREELKARLKGLPSPLSEEEQKILKEWEAKKSISTDDTPRIILSAGQLAKKSMSTIIIPTGKLAPKSTSDDAQLNFFCTKDGTIVRSSHDMLKKKREELKQKGGFGTRDKQIMTPQGAFTYRTVREQWILNENVKVLFDNESLLKVYQGVNIPDEMGQNMDDFDGTLKQKREELRKRLLSPGRIIE